MNKLEIFKRLYKDYTKKHLRKIILSAIFSILVAGSTSGIAWLLDPAIKKIFIEKDQSLIFIIPLLIVLAFATKGISLYVAKSLMIQVGDEISKFLQFDMVKSLIKAVIYCYLWSFLICFVIKFSIKPSWHTTFQT